MGCMFAFEVSVGGQRISVTAAASKGEKTTRNQQENRTLVRKLTENSALGTTTTDLGPKTANI